MSGETYIRLDGVTVIFDVQREGHSIGLVWEKGNNWYADPCSMSSPQICEASREAAAEKL